MGFLKLGKVLGSVAGALIGSKSSKKASKAEAAAYQAAIDEQRRQFDVTQNLLAPQRQLGNAAMDTLGRLYGYGPVSGATFQNPYTPTTSASSSGGVVNNLIAQLRGDSAAESAASPATTSAPASAGAPDMSVFFASPDYEFRRGEGTRDLNNSFAARGGALSGNALRALSQYNQNLASGEYGNFINRQLAMAGLGQAATSQGASAAMQSGANIGNLLGAQGQARSSGITNSANNLIGGLGDLASWLGYYKGNQSGATPPIRGPY